MVTKQADYTDFTFSEDTSVADVLRSAREVIASSREFCAQLRANIAAEGNGRIPAPFQKREQEAQAPADESKPQ